MLNDTTNFTKLMSENENGHGRNDTNLMNEQNIQGVACGRSQDNRVAIDFLVTEMACHAIIRAVSGHKIFNCCVKGLIVSGHHEEVHG